LLSATTKEEDLAETIDRYADMPISRLIFSKMDETGSFGGIINQLVRTKLPVSYFTCGPRVPEDIETVSVEKIVERVFQENSRGTIWSEPPEVIAEAMEKFERRLMKTSLKRDVEQTDEMRSYNRFGKFYNRGEEEKMASGY
jgi:signal recognition particle GTPase